LRWALFEASMCAARQCSPDYEYYSQAAERRATVKCCGLGNEE
jgi:hypothetical protein